MGYVLKLKRPRRVCRLSNWNHVLPNLGGSFSLRVRGHLVLSVLCTLSLLDCRTIQQNVYIGTKTEAIVRSGRCSRQRCSEKTITRVRRISKSEGGSSVSTYAVAAESDRFRRPLPRNFLAWTLSGILFKTFHTAPYTREVNVMQHVIGRTFSHKLLEIVVSTTRARRGYDKVCLPGVQTKVGRWGSPPVLTTSQVIHWPSFSFTWDKYPLWEVGESKVILEPRS